MLYDYLLIWGKGGHSRVVTDNLDGRFYHIEYADDNDADLWEDNALISKYSPGFWSAHVAIGDNYVRERVFKRLRRLGYALPPIISPSATVSRSAIISPGAFIGPKACVNIDAEVWTGAIVNTCASVDHDCRVQDFVHIAPGTHLCGNVHIGYRCLIGVGTAVIPNIEIADDCIVAGGSSVKQDLNRQYSLYAGNPAIFKKLLR